MSESTFDYWRKKYHPDHRTNTKFIKITPTVSSVSSVEVHYPNGVRIVVARDMTLISQLIHLY
ncbi:IS66 family insertion sequence element accessory protein TnpA [Rhizosphaericola mali]|uniref:IS66 family insertion sequence element accessory protein TnpA n=1 Tax=Rhizosphaericola mali TaxID=2545455 RepID=UPI00389B269A